MILTQILFLLGAGTFIASASGAIAGDDLSRFLAQRDDRARALAETIAACVARTDTDHPVFRGCIDWHSSVHGVWALSAYARVTGDRRHDALVQRVLSPEGLAQERAWLAAHPDFEMPYGRAWFLRLAIDYKRAFGDDRLDAMARDVAQSLVAHYRAQPPDPASMSYGSASWALINLHDFGAFTGDAQITAFVEEIVRARFLKAQACPLQAVEVETREFMAVCTTWAWLVGRVLPHDAFIPWLAQFLPPTLSIDPITEPASVHQAGLNFSRAWGLWGLYSMTGDRRFLDAHIRHFEAGFGRRDIWDGNYERHSHWIPQFGMLAIVLTHDEKLPPAR